MALHSFSEIKTFDTCPFRYKLAYIDKIEVEDTIETFLGSRVHETLEKLYRDRIHEKLLTLEETIAFFNRRWEEEWRDTILIVNKEYNEKNYRKMGEAQIANYYKRYWPFDQGRIVAIETKEIIPLDEEGKYKVHIRIDRLNDMGDGVYEVHDYKTSLTLPIQEDLDKDIQLTLYSLWVKERFKDFKVARLVWHYLAFDREFDSYRRKEELEELRKEILNKINEIEQAQEFPPNVSSLCAWCSYKPLCPMWKHGIELQEKPENEYLNDPGVRLVDEYVRIKRELDEHRKEAEEKLEKLKEALILFCEREEVRVVFGTKNKITIKEYERLKLPSKDTENRECLIAALKEIGRLEEVSDINIHALNKIFENREWDDELINKIEKFLKKEKDYRIIISKK